MNVLFATLLACTAPDADSDTSVEIDPLAPGFLGRLEVAFAIRYDTSFAIELVNDERTVRTLVAVGHDDLVELEGVMAVGETAGIWMWVGTDLQVSACYDPDWEGSYEQELEASAGTVTVDFDASGGTYGVEGATFEREGESPIVESATGVVDAWQEPCEPD